MTVIWLTLMRVGWGYNGTSRVEVATFIYVVVVRFRYCQIRWPLAGSKGGKDNNWKQIKPRKY